MKQNELPERIIVQIELGPENIKFFHALDKRISGVTTEKRFPNDFKIVEVALSYGSQNLAISHSLDNPGMPHR